MRKHLTFAQNRPGIIYIGVVVLVFFSSVALVSAVLKFNESTSAATAVTGPAAYQALQAFPGGKSGAKPGATYQYWVRINGTYDLSCCGDSNPSEVTSNKSYKFSLATAPDSRGYEAVVCSPGCEAPNSAKWHGPALFSPFAEGGFFIVDGERGGTYTTNDADKDGFSDIAEVYMKTDPVRSCPTNVTNSAWPPDMNNDGRIDLFRDVFAIARKSGSVDVRYDLNQDGKVDSKDTFIVAGSFGKSCPGGSTNVVTPKKPDGAVVPTPALDIPVLPKQQSAGDGAGTPAPTPTTQTVAADSDKDGFSDSQEAYMGTNPNLACGANAFPPDVDSNGTIDLFIDIFTVSNANGTSNKRYDMNQDGKVDKTDAEIVSKYYGDRCK